MTLRCKHCGAEQSLTERESMGIAQDLDRHYTIEEQAQLTFTSVCGDCWPKEQARLREAGATGRPKRVVIVGAHAA